MVRFLSIKFTEKWDVIQYFYNTLILLYLSILIILHSLRIKGHLQHSVSRECPIYMTKKAGVK